MSTRVFTPVEAISQSIPAAVKGEAKKGLLHKFNAPLVREKGSMDQGKGTYDKEKVLVARETDLGGGRTAGEIGKETNRFSIQAEAEATLIDTVQDFVHNLDNPVLTANLEPWQQDFIKQFKQNAANRTSAPYDPTQLHHYAEDFVRTNEGVVAALKIAEWKVALYQRATGAQMEEIQSHNVTHNPDIIASGVDEEISTPERNLIKKIGAKIGIGLTPLEQAKRDKTKADKKRPVNEKDKNYYSRAKFTNPNQLRYSGALLTPGQRAYLRSVGIDVETPAIPAMSPNPAVPAAPRNKDFNNAPGSGNRNASAEQVRLGKIMESLTDARVAVYEATGKFNVDINLVDRAGNYIGTPENFLRIEHRSATGADLRLSIENQLQSATEEMKTENKKAAKKAAAEVKAVKTQAKKEKAEADEAQKEQRKKEGVELTVHLIEDKKLELAKGPAPVAPDVQKTIDTNATTVANETKKAEELRATVEEGKNFPDLKKSVDDAQAVIPVFAEVQTLNLPVNAAGLPQPGSVREAEANQMAAEKKAKEANAKLTLAKKRQQDASDAILKTKGMDPSVIPVVQAEYQNTRDISATQTEYDNALATQESAVAEYTKRKAIQDKYSGEWQAYQQAQEALTTAVRSYTDMATRHGVAVVAVDVNGIPGLHIREADIQTVITAAEANIKSLETANAKLADPDKMAREHQSIAYEELSTAITPPAEYEKMQQRIDDLDLKQKEPLIKDMRAAGIYEEYPHVYLRALQVVFGWDITDYSKAAEFQKATQLLTPQMFINTLDPSLLRKPNPGVPPPPTVKITDPFDPALRNPTRMKALSSKVMTGFTTAMLDDASKGKLGQLSQVEITAREDMQTRNGTDIFVAAITPADRNTMVANLTTAIYHYEDVDDLARIIQLRAPAAVGTASIVNADDAKAYAKEIVRRRNIVI